MDPERPRRTQAERTDATRAALIGAAAVVVARVGYRDATLQDIAAEAGVSKGALTHHFGAKDELVADLARNCADIVVRGITAAASREGPPAARLRGIVRALRGAADAGDPAFESLVELMSVARCDEAMRARLADARRRLEDALGAALAATADLAGLRARVTPRVLAGVLLTLHVGRALAPRQDGGETDEAAETLLLAAFAP